MSVGTTGLTIAMFIGSNPAHALTFGFSQLGWEQDGEATGAEVVGTFSGEDKDGNGSIEFKFDTENNEVAVDNEVSAYEMNFFSGTSTFMDFTHTLENIDLSVFFLEYTIGDSSGLIVSIGDRSLGNISNYDSEGFNNRAIVNQDGQDNPITTSETVSISIREVPEPTSSIGLMLFGLGGYLKRKIGTKLVH